MTITPKELYELAKLNNAENRPIFIDYECNDDFYDYVDELHECEISFVDKEKVIIDLTNF